jgi:hypothetical protein
VIRIFTISVVIAALLVWPFYAFGHSWYDPECCSDRDCKPVYAPEEDLEELPNGAWRHKPSGLTFKREDVKPSKDRHFHVCIHPTLNIPYCIYILQGT